MLALAAPHFALCRSIVGGAPALGPAAALRTRASWHLITLAHAPSLVCSTAEERLYWEQWLVDVTVLPPPPADFEERNAFAASSLRAQRRQRVQVCRPLVAELRAAGKQMPPAACGGGQYRPHVRVGLGRRLLCMQTAGRCWALLGRDTQLSVPSLQAALEECLTQIVEKGAPLLSAYVCLCLPFGGPLPRQQVPLPSGVLLAESGPPPGNLLVCLLQPALPECPSCPAMLTPPPLQSTSGATTSRPWSPAQQSPSHLTSLWQGEACGGCHSVGGLPSMHALSMRASGPACPGVVVACVAPPDSYLCICKRWGQAPAAARPLIWLLALCNGMQGQRSRLWP